MKKIFIGIDFSKEKFDATLIKAEGLKECAPSMHEVFDNKTSGFRRLVRWVKAQSEGLPIDTWIFCGENTGAYSIGLSNYLYASGYDEPGGLVPVLTESHRVALFYIIRWK